MYPLYSLSLFISFVRLGSCAYNLTNGTNSTTPTSSGQFPLTTDESCGADVGRMCVINGIFPFCSGNGFCGGDDQYCGQTCQPEYGSCVKPNSTLGNPACSWANSGNSPRCDGRCGADFGGALCSQNSGPDDFGIYGVFQYGPCCSQAGYCGNTAAHCSASAGCQSGCAGGSSTAASSSSATVPVTVTVVATASSTKASDGNRNILYAKGLLAGLLITVSAAFLVL